MQMKNILVTGGCGFIGTNFIHYLFESTGFDGRIINLDKLSYAANPANLKEIERKYPGRYHFVQGDICNLELVDQLFKTYQIDTVCHFAAESHVDRSIQSALPFIQTNIVGTFTLLEVAKKYRDQLHLFHHVSTDEVYGSLGDTGFFTENTPYKPNNPYSASKAGSDHLVHAYGNTYGLPVTISNCSNNYGPFQFPEKLIPQSIIHLTKQKPIPVYGSGKNTRDWLFVRDHCDAIWTIMTKANRGQTYNIGGHNEIQNIEIVHTLCDLYDDFSRKKGNPSRNLITFVTDRPGHDWRYAIDPAKIQKELNWKCRETFETGIEKTFRWYMDHLQWTEQALHLIQQKPFR